MSEEPLPNSEVILYQTEDGRTRIQCRFENETVWLTQALIAELFEIGVNTVNYHLKAIFAEGELRAEATIRYYRIVRTEGARQITRQIEHYNLDAILAVGFRVRSHRGTQFRQWATGVLRDFAIRGYVLDKERLNVIRVATPSLVQTNRAFHRTCALLFEQVEANRPQSRTLAALRDTLLPKLLNGELRTAELEANIQA